MKLDLDVELQAFTGFRFFLGQLVAHRASTDVGVVTSRILVQTANGITGHVYSVAVGDCGFQWQDVELEPFSELSKNGETK